MKDKLFSAVVFVFVVAVVLAVLYYIQINDVITNVARILSAL